MGATCFPEGNSIAHQSSSVLVSRSLLVVFAEFPLSTGGEAEVPWSFIEDAVAQPDYPEYKCPAVIVHGLDDHVVPAKSTRDIVEGR